MSDYRNSDLMNMSIPKFPEANCLTVGDPELFFYNGRERGAIDQIRAAKRVCENCVHKVQCLEFAIEHEIKEGIWGGTSEYERRKLMRKAKA